jgi:hypothetical protein
MAPVADDDDIDEDFEDDDFGGKDPFEDDDDAARLDTSGSSAMTMTTKMKPSKQMRKTIVPGRFI